MNNRQLKPMTGVQNMCQFNIGTFMSSLQQSHTYTMIDDCLYVRSCDADLVPFFAV